MADNTRTITIKFTGNVKDLVAAAATADISLSKVDTSSTKSKSGLDKLSKSLGDFAKSMDPVILGAKKFILVEAAITAVVAAGRYLAPMIGLIGLLPGVMAIAGSAMLVTKLGAAGLQAAFKGVGDSAKKSVSDTFQKDMAPAAKNVNQLLKALTPTLDLIAKAMSGVAVRITGMLNSSKGIAALHTIFMATELAVTNVGNAIGSLLDAFLAVAKVAAPMFAGLTGGLTTWAATFDAKVQAVAANGKLQTWIQNGINRFTAFKNAIVKFFKEIEPILKNLLGIKLTIFNDLTPALIPILTAISKFIKDNPNLAAYILAAAFATKALAPAVQGIQAVASAGWVGVIIAALVLLAAAFVYLWTHSSAFRVFWINLWKDIQSIVKSIVGWFTSSVVPFFKNIWDKITILAKTFAQFWKAFWNSDLGAVVKNALSTLWTIIKTAWLVIVLLFKADFDILKGIVEAAWTFIKAIFQGAFNIIRGILDVFIGLFTGNWSKAWQGVKEITTGIWDILKGAFNALLDVFRGIGHAIGDVCSGIGGVFKGMVNIVVGGLNGLIGVVNIAIDALNTLASGLSHAWTWAGVPAIPAIPHIPKVPEWRKDGGTTEKGKPYIVGDNGPELFWPGQTGRITNSDQSGGMLGGGPIDLTLDLGEGITQRIRIEQNKHNRKLRAKVLTGSGVNK